MLAEPIDPPPALWHRIEHTLFAAQRDTSATLTRARHWWNSLNIWRGLAAGGFAAAAILLAVLTMQSTPTQTPDLQQRFMVVLSSPDNNTPGWIIEADANRQSRLIPLHPVDIPSAHALQFWTKADGWSGLVSLGLVQPGQTINVPFDKLPPLQPNQLFEITLESRWSHRMVHPSVAQPARLSSSAAR